MSKEDKSSPSPGNHGLFDATNHLLGPPPISGDSSSPSIVFPHLGHLPAFSLLSPPPGFPPASLFGSLGLMNPLHSFAHGANPMTGGAEWWRSASEHARRLAGGTGVEYYAGSLGNNLSQTFTTLDCGLELSHSGLELLLRGPADMDGSSLLSGAVKQMAEHAAALAALQTQHAGSKSGSKMSANAFLNGSMLHLERSPKLVQKRKPRSAKPSSASLGKPSPSPSQSPSSVSSVSHERNILKKTLENSSRHHNNGTLLPTHDSDGHPDVSSVSSGLSDDSSANDDDAVARTTTPATSMTEFEKKAGALAHQIDGLKKKLLADQIRHRMQSKAGPSSPVTAAHSVHNKMRGHRSKVAKSGSSDSSVSQESGPQKNRQQELKLQLEAELKQQQLNLKLMRRKQKEKSDDHHPSSEQPVASTSSSSSMATASTSHITSHSSSPTSLKLHISKSLIQKHLNHNEGEETPSTSKSNQNSSGSEDDSDSDSNDDDSNDSNGSSDSDPDKDPSETGVFASHGHGSVEGDEPPAKRRKLVTNELDLRIPLEHGWQRTTTIHTMGRRGIVGEVLYSAPCGKKMKTIPDVMRYLARNQISDLTRDNFTFNTKVNVGDVYEIRSGETTPFQLSEPEILERIALSKGKQGRRAQAQRRQEKAMKQQQLAKQYIEMKMKKKTEQQDQEELARKAAIIKFHKKLEKQRQNDLIQKAKNLKALERQKQKEQIKMLKEQDRFRRQEQLRLEKEMRAQHVLETKRRRQEEIEHIRYVQTLQKAKSNLLWFHMEREREMKRQHAIVLREQERERRRQHIILVKALEARKKQQVRDKVREERMAERRLSKEKKMEQRRMELELAREMKRPAEDLELDDLQPMPIFPRIHGVKMEGNAFADCLMALEFMHNFVDALGLDKDSIPTMHVLQNGLLNTNEEDMEELMTLFSHLLRFALDDPGVPNPKEAVTKLNQRITDIELTDSTLSEVLRVFVTVRSGGKNEMSEWLEFLPLEALNATKKSSILAFLCNELLSSRILSGEIDKNIEKINNLRRDKWIVEGKIRKLRIIQAKLKSPKKADRPTSTAGDDDSMNVNNVSMESKHGSEEDEEEDEEKDEEKDDEESGNESDVTNATGPVSDEEEEKGLTIEDCDRRIEKLQKQHGMYRNKVFDASHRLRGITMGQDRYKRRYWVLPAAGGVYIEGFESAYEVYDDPERDVKSEENTKEEKHGDKDGKLEENTTEEKLEKNAAEDKCKQEVKLEESITKEKQKKEMKEDENKIEEKHKDIVKNEKKEEIKNEEVVKSDKTGVSKCENENEMLEISTEVKQEIVDVSENQNSDISKNLNSDISDNYNSDLSENQNADTLKKETSERVKSENVECVKKEICDDSKLENSDTSKSESSDISCLKKEENQNVKTDEKDVENKLWTLLRKENDEVKLSNGDTSKQSVNNSTSEKNKMEDAKKTKVIESNLFMHSPSLSDIFHLPKINDSLDVANILHSPTISVPCPSSPLLTSSPLFVHSTPLTSPTSASPSIKTESKHNFTSIDSLLKKETKELTNCLNNNHFLPLNVFPPSPLISDHYPQSYKDILDQKPWFSILPRMPCDEMSLTRSPHPSAAPTGSLSNTSATFFPFLPYQSPSFSTFQMGNSTAENITSSSDLSGNLVPFKVPPPPSEKMASSNFQEMYIEKTEPVPIPEDKCRGWWQISDEEQLKNMLKCLHSRGIRERSLTKMIQKYLEYASTCIAKGSDKTILGFPPPEEKKHTSGEKEKQKADSKAEQKSITEEKSDSDENKSEKTADAGIEIMEETPAPDSEPPSKWYPQVAYEVEMSALEEVEALEDRIYQASLQVKGWKVPPKATEDSKLELVKREDDAPDLKDNQRYPLDVARDRLSLLETNVERRYLKPPLTKSMPLNLANISGSEGHPGIPEEVDDDVEQVVAPGLLLWRQAVASSVSSAQLMLCVLQLNGAISWEKSIMKVICQICRKDDNEAELLLCDGCDKGYHTYCFKPKMDNIPEGDWYCYECVSKASGASHCIVCGKKVGKIVECDRCPRAIHIDCLNPPLPRLPKKWSCAACLDGKKPKRPRKKAEAEKRQRKDSEAKSSDSGPAEKKKKEPATPSKDKESAVFSKLLTEMEKHDAGWPFLHAVNVKKFPSYKKIIKTPMDLSAMKAKLRDNMYKVPDDFATDARIMFNNCETFNEDNSEVGRAGHTLRNFFEKRWKELFGDDR